MISITISIQGITVAILLFIPFEVASEDVGHFKHDDDLGLTRWAWFQADHAYVYVRVVEVEDRQAPAPLCDRHLKYRSLEQRYIWREYSLVNWRIAEIVLDPL